MHEEKLYVKNSPPLNQTWVARRTNLQSQFSHSELAGPGISITYPQSYSYITYPQCFMFMGLSILTATLIFRS